MKIQRKNVLCFILLFLLTGTIIPQAIETVVQAGHYASVTAVCYSYDGKFIATGSSDKTIILWRSTDGKQIRSFRGNTTAISHVEFNRQGTSILSLSQDGTWMIWDITTGQIISKMKPEGTRFTFASFSPDGSQIVSGSRKSGITVWNAETREKIIDLKPLQKDLYTEKSFDYPEAATVVFSNDGQYIVVGAGDNTAILFDVKTGKEIRKFKKTNSTCTSCIIESAITPDNKYILIAQSDSIKMFDRISGVLVREFFGQGGSPE
jgi:WD40 repeat protein